jgi:phospholipid transport system transporter-binding protein
MAQVAQILQQDNRWVLSGDVVIGNASALLKASEKFALNQTTLIDFASVQDIDTAAISLILEWRRRAALEKQQIECVNLPQNLTNLTELYGVAEFVS